MSKFYRGISALLVFFLLLSFKSNLQKKIIREGRFDIECYVYLKKVKDFDSNKEYFWFKAGSIHNSVANAGGLVLHKKYTKHYRSNQLAEQGEFNYGLKDGLWQEWYENGNLKSSTEWESGFKECKYNFYDENGSLILSGKYRQSKKINTWINHKIKDTIFYKKDSAYSVKPKSKLGNLFDKIFKSKDSLNRAQQKLERKSKRKQDSINRSSRRLERENKND